MPQTNYTFSYKDITDRKRKNLSILDCIRRKGTISRTDISKETGINIVSVSNYITNYIKKNLVLECGLDISTGGRRPELVKLNLENAYIIGVDLGPEKIVSVITDLGLKAKAKISIPRPQTNIEEAVKDTTEAIDKLIKSNNINIKDVRLIGIGASGVVDITSGTIHDTDPNRGRTRTNIFSFAKSLENKFKIQALVGNDATCAAFGELNLNQGSEISNMLFIYSDVGCGIIINGDIYCGSSGAAGEIQLLLNGKPEKYTLDEEAAYGIRGVDLGITDKAKELIADEKNSLIAKLSKNDKNKITKELILQAAKEKDKFAVKLIVDAAHWLGIKVAYLINIFNPQIVAIGGGMEKGGEAFFNPLIACIKIHAFEECFNAVKILPSYLGEDAVSLGAAALSVRELFLNA